jgi:hypothetical protein
VTLKFFDVSPLWVMSLSPVLESGWVCDFGTDIVRAK